MSDLSAAPLTDFPSKFSVPFLPFESSDQQLGMGPIPLLTENRETLHNSEVGTLFAEGQAIKEGMAKFLQSAILPMR